MFSLGTFVGAKGMFIWTPHYYIQWRADAFIVCIQCLQDLWHCVVIKSWCRSLRHTYKSNTAYFEQVRLEPEVRTFLLPRCPHKVWCTLTDVTDGLCNRWTSGLKRDAKASQFVSLAASLTTPSVTEITQRSCDVLVVALSGHFLRRACSCS
jgi:hypothetical protein